VGPKVFADVPSAAELAAVRRNRNGLAVWVVLLLGMLIATVGGSAAGYTLFVKESLDQYDEILTAKQDAEKALDAAIAEINNLAVVLNKDARTPYPVLASWTGVAEDAAPPDLVTALETYTQHADRLIARVDAGGSDLYQPLRVADQQLRAEIERTKLVIGDRGGDVGVEPRGVRESAAERAEGDPLRTAVETFDARSGWGTGGWIGETVAELQAARATIRNACGEIEDWIPTGESRADLQACLTTP
jgi:hypothetical protein